MTPAAAVEAVRGRALALLGPGQTLALASDAETFAKAKNRPSVLLAIARPGCSVVLAIDSGEFDGVAIALMAGFEPAVPITAHEKAQQGLTKKR